MNPEVYRTLIPNPAKHKRTRSDKQFRPERITIRTDAHSTLRVRGTKPGLKTPSLISSYKGSLDRLLFSFPPYGLSDPRLYNAYQSLISNLRVGTKFVVACLESDKPVIELWFTSRGHDQASIEWAFMPAFTSFTDWAEDAYVGLVDADDGQHYLMEPWEFRRGGDALIADTVEEYTGDIRAAQAPLMFQGGNCLVADEHWFLGRDYFFDCIDLVRTDRAPVNVPVGATEEEVVFSLFKEYLDSDRDLVLLGSTMPIPLPEIVGTMNNGRYYLDLPTGGNGAYQPIFHIDMLLSLIGDRGNGFEVMVGDPDLADSMLGTSSPYALAGEYQKIADQISALGITVHRNPLVHWPTERQSLSLDQLEGIGTANNDQVLLDACDELRRLGASGNTAITVREWHHITWNNSLVESSSQLGKHVYLPNFGYADKASLHVLDQYMKSMWEGLGYTVHMLGDFNAFAERSGVVHCISKYIGRTEDRGIG